MGILRSALPFSCCVLNLGAHTSLKQPDVFLQYCCIVGLAVQDRIPTCLCSLRWVFACMASMFELRQCGPDILAQHSAWNVLLPSSVCLKIPSYISGGVRVIHALQPCPYCSLLNLSVTVRCRCCELGLFVLAAFLVVCICFVWV